jgi:hypothetical protein
MPGPTIEAERGHPVRVEWINELEGTLPVAVTVAPTETTAEGVPVQCVPGLSGGVRDADAAVLLGLDRLGGRAVAMVAGCPAALGRRPAPANTGVVESTI